MYVSMEGYLCHPYLPFPRENAYVTHILYHVIDILAYFFFFSKSQRIQFTIVCIMNTPLILVLFIIVYVFIFVSNPKILRNILIL